ncbi:MAG: hypothetical protein Q9M36_05850 [Sulfurovum sp.]|nr:hypothetical protein [Sulfurovum sp.]
MPEENNSVRGNIFLRLSINFIFLFINMFPVFIVFFLYMNNRDFDYLSTDSVNLAIIAFLKSLIAVYSSIGYFLNGLFIVLVAAKSKLCTLSAKALASRNVLKVRMWNEKWKSHNKPKYKYI